MSNSATFKVRLKRTRKNRNLTQEQLAEAVGLGVRTIGRYEQVKKEADENRLSVTFEEIQKIIKEQLGD